MIRQANERDLARIAEILVFDKRVSYRPIFRDDGFSFNVLTVPAVMAEYAPVLGDIRVYDDGIVRGMTRVIGDELRELYVDWFFQGTGIGAALMLDALARGARWLWVLEKNEKAIRFYESFGFTATDTRKRQGDTDQFLVMMRRDT